MSVSGISGSSNWYQLWADLKTHSAGATQATDATQTGTAAQAAALALAGVQTVTATSGSQSTSSPSADAFQQAMSSLSQALQNGDLGAAQTAFAQVKAALAASSTHAHHHHHHRAAGSSQTGTSQQTSSDPFAQAFEAIGQALQGGDLSGASSAFSQLQTLLQNSTNGSTASAVSAGSSTNPVGGAVDLTA